MKSAVRHAYYVIVSPEGLVVIIVAFALIRQPSWIAPVSSAFAKAPDAAKYVALAPAAVCVWCWRNGQGILFPPEDKKGRLQDWPRYPELKVRIFIGLLFQVLFAVSSFVGWVISPSLADPFSSVLVAGAIIGSGLGAWTFYGAAIAVREITKRASTSRSR